MEKWKDTVGIKEKSQKIKGTWERKEEEINGGKIHLKTFLHHVPLFQKLTNVLVSSNVLKSIPGGDLNHTLHHLLVFALQQLMWHPEKNTYTLKVPK